MDAHSKAKPHRYTHLNILFYSPVLSEALTTNRTGLFVLIGWFFLSFLPPSLKNRNLFPSSGKTKAGERLGNKYHQSTIK